MFEIWVASDVQVHLLLKLWLFYKWPEIHLRIRNKKDLTPPEPESPNTNIESPSIKTQLPNVSDISTPESEVQSLDSKRP